ncbi:LppU/SCO3897 family protein [Pseudonocardia sp. TRM90224]|uniref:LppU/SCO3897 family protein n=1 Tax=Pseudonocardia sp. TRM90224 TaxID=2812678 RepID=UPI001E4A62A6|nr:hypothetical protein [Pseudonocardia sp. TRM90224]
MIIPLRTHVVRALLSAAALLVVGFATLACGTPEPPHPADTGGSVDVSVKVGECLTLGGSEANASATPAPCGSAESTHRVTGKAPKQEDCSKDTDAVYFEEIFTAQTGALCLEIDWAKGQCYKLSDAGPTKHACVGGDPAVVKIGETVEGATDESACANGGTVYAVRKVAVCFEQPV